MEPSGKYPSGTLYSEYSNRTVTSFCAAAGTAVAVAPTTARAVNARRSETVGIPGRRHRLRAGTIGYL